jgi:acid phosphatase
MCFAAFLTPNMTNDAHDTNVTFAGQWLRKWLPQFLNNTYFMDNTLLMVTFDESDDYPIQNRECHSPC